LAGAALDRRDGDSGWKGAIMGAVAGRAIKAGVPMAAAATLGWMAFSAIRRARGKTAAKETPPHG
jgi:hypothetical protein